MGNRKLFCHGYRVMIAAIYPLTFQLSKGLSQLDESDANAHFTTEELIEFALIQSKDYEHGVSDLPGGVTQEQYCQVLYDFVSTVATWVAD